MAGVSAIFGLIGTIVSAAGTIAAGQAEKEQADYEAKQLDLKAQEEQAASQREAFEADKEKRLVVSRQQALAAASGLTASDPTVVDITSGTEAYGVYRSRMFRYGGEERATGLRAQAEGRRISGQAAAQGAMYSALGTVIGGFGSFFGKYGGAGPPASSAGGSDLYGYG